MKLKLFKPIFFSLLRIELCAFDCVKKRDRIISTSTTIFVHGIHWLHDFYFDTSMPLVFLGPCNVNNDPRVRRNTQQCLIDKLQVGQFIFSATRCQQNTTANLIEFNINRFFRVDCIYHKQRLIDKKIDKKIYTIYYIFGQSRILFIEALLLLFRLCWWRCVAGATT